MRYYTDTQKLENLSKRIDRLEKALTRVETLALSSTSSAGTSKSFLDPQKIKMEIDRCIAEYDFVSTRNEHGTWNNPQVKKVIFKDGSNI